MVTVTLYGIPNCDIVKTARRWLAANDVQYHFHDYKKEGIDTAVLLAWMHEKGWKQILNARSTTYKDLLAAGLAQVTDEKGAVQLLKDNTSIIKRPILAVNDKIIVGYNEIEYIDALKK